MRVLNGLMLWVSAVVVQGATVVLPSGFAATAGDTSSGFPFNNVARYQQLYRAVDFPTGSPLLLSQVAFRRDETAGPFSTTVPRLRVDLSTCTVFGSTFDSNVGSDDTMVFGDISGSALNVSSLDNGAAPHPFEIIIPLTTPFVYNPALGDLLLDVRVWNASTTTVLTDAATGSSVDRLYAYAVNATSGTTGKSFHSLVVRSFVSPAVVFVWLVSLLYLFGLSGLLLYLSMVFVVAGVLAVVTQFTFSNVSNTPSRSPTRYLLHVASLVQTAVPCRAPLLATAPPTLVPTTLIPTSMRPSPAPTRLSTPWGFAT